jgi:hypothetical protein
MQRFNEEVLSAYVDGEIDIATAEQVENVLESDPAARRYILEAVKTTVRLRATVNDTLRENIPERLLAAIGPETTTGARRWRRANPIFRIAAMLLLVVAGFGSGVLIYRNGSQAVSAFVPVIPAGYRHVLNQALEYDLSGTIRKWQAPNATVSVLVTPVKTYRDSRGIYFRKYHLEVIMDAERNRIQGLAYRDTNGKWQTKALVF